MPSARLIARLLGVALMVGGLATVTAFAPVGSVVEFPGGTSEVPADIGVDEEKTLPALAEVAALVVARSDYASAHAIGGSTPRGAPPTPPPEA